MTNTNLPEKLEATIKIGRPARDWKVELQKIVENVYKERKYVTYTGKASKQDIVRMAQVLKQTYRDWDIFANTASRSIVFRKKI